MARSVIEPQQAGEHNISFYHIFIILHKLTRGHDKKNTSQTTVLKGKPQTTCVSRIITPYHDTHLAIKYCMKSANQENQHNAITTVLNLFEFFSDSPCSIYKNFNMTPRLSGHFPIIGLVFFVLKSLLGMQNNGAVKSLQFRPQSLGSNVRSSLYQTWAIVFFFSRLIQTLINAATVVMIAIQMQVVRQIPLETSHAPVSQVSLEMVASVMV